MTYFNDDWGVNLTHPNGEVELEGDGESRHLLHSKVGCTRDLVLKANNILLMDIGANVGLFKSGAFGSWVKIRVYVTWYQA